MENIINPRIVPVILCGGTGKRLWPFSRESYPKQFLGYEKSDKKTFLQETYKRLIDLTAAALQVQLHVLYLFFLSSIRINKLEHDSIMLFLTKLVIIDTTQN